MSGVLRALFDPASKLVDLLGTQRLPEFGGWHAIIIFACDACNEFALGRIPGDDGERTGVEFTGRNLRVIQSQAGFEVGFVRAMARETLVRQDWPNVGVEIDVLPECQWAHDKSQNDAETVRHAESLLRRE